LVALSTMSPFSTPAANAEMFAAKSNWGCLANEGGAAVLRPCSASRHNLQIQYLPAENVFYGPLRLNGQCLDIRGSSVVFSGCNGGTSQTWKFSGTGQLNNSFSCVVGSGNNLVVRACPAAGAWANVSYKVLQISGIEGLARGTALVIRDGNLFNPRTNQMVAAGGLNLIGQDGSTLIGQDGSTVIATGSGSVLIGRNAAQLVAAGAGN
jgi:hypothetical protein